MTHVLVTGGAGYIGSLFTGLLLHRGYRMTVVDDLLFGGESLLGYWHHPGDGQIWVSGCSPHRAFTPCYSIYSMR